MELKVLVAEKLASAGPSVKEKVLTNLFDKELDRRTAAVMKIVDKLDAFEKDLKKKEKGDIETFDAKGKALPAVFSKQRNEELKKLRENITKHEKALELAFDKSDFSKVLELAGGGNEKPAE